MIMVSSLALALGSIVYSAESRGADFMVYSVYRGVDLGITGEQPQKDYFVSIGSDNGVRVGAQLEVIRKVPSYDVTNQKLFRDLAFPIAKLKVIHVENNAAIARLDKMHPADSTPVISPRAVMVGDLVRAR
ncbi:MAG: hypothetical protein A2583_16745 [Bdellovibrionales bacterium RIFOXYD1_FULL_53_11]|nr:MAG: hypothetical protein A2583_16745 [Bdellovibrionales bacterium RIFOXYD1_FULL_53_11]